MITDQVPTGVPDRYSILSSGTTTVDASGGVLANDNDPDNPITAVLMMQPSHGTLAFNADGSFSYTPGAGFAGSDMFGYVVQGGTQQSGPVSVLLTTAPTASNLAFSGTHDQVLSVAPDLGLLAPVSNPNGGTLTPSVVSGPAHGTVVLNTDGSFAYTPTAHFAGTDSFLFQVSNGSQTSNQATVAIVVGEQPPEGTASFFSTPQNSALTVSAADGLVSYGYDAQGTSLTAALVSGPAHGSVTVNSDGSFVYTPYTNWFGLDVFTYRLSDGLSFSNPVTVKIRVDQEILSTNPSSSPGAVALGDFNGDGTLDSALLDQGLNKVSIELGSASGTQMPGLVSDVSVASSPTALVVGDFNGDGKADLAVASSGTNTITVYLGNGNGTFTTGTAFATGSSPAALVTGDFNRDGKLDLAVSNRGTGTVSVFLGAGNGTFGSASAISTGTTPVALAVGDLNGDGKQDLIVANSGDNTVSILLGNGDGTFAATTTVTVGLAPKGVALGDFNGDGTLDLAVANSGAGTVSVLFGSGNGSFGTSTDYAVGSSPVAVAAGDFDGNGTLDLVVANRNSDTISKLLNIGSGTFWLAENYRATSHPSAIAIGDLNHDGILDQVFALADPGEKVVIEPGVVTTTVTPTSVVTSKDGGRIAALDSKQNAVKVWGSVGMKPNQAVAYLPFKGGVKAVAISPTNNNLLALAVPGKVVLYNVVTKMTQELTFLDGKVTPVTLAFSSDGKFLVAGSSDRVGKSEGVLWDVSNLANVPAGVPFSSLGRAAPGVFEPFTQLLVTSQAGTARIVAVGGLPGLASWSYLPARGMTPASTTFLGEKKQPGDGQALVAALTTDQRYAAVASSVPTINRISFWTLGVIGALDDPARPGTYEQKGAAGPILGVVGLNDKTILYADKNGITQVSVVGPPGKLDLEGSSFVATTDKDSVLKDTTLTSFSLSGDGSTLIVGVTDNETGKGKVILLNTKRQKIGDLK